MPRNTRYKAGKRIGGRYLVYQALMGGMGEVYLCLDEQDNLPYALKTFQQHHLTSPRLRSLFENEVSTWVSLEKHPNIVRCFLLDVIDNQPFMFLEWIANEEGRGTDLRSWLQHGPLDLRLALDLTIDVCRGLIHANGKQPGIVHRDLKPGNIIVGQGSQAKITDFGLAQVVQKAGPETTVTGEGDVQGRRSSMCHAGFAGTPAYAAPEQWRGKALDARTDLYALGCILYELLTGAHPFQANTADGWRRQHLEANAPRLEEDPTDSGRLNALLGQCMAKRREERPESARDLLERLTSIYEQQFSAAPRALVAGDDMTARDYLNRGITYERLHRYEESLADHTLALELDPTYALAYNNRGNTLSKLQRYGDALVDHSRAVELEPEWTPAYVNRGLTYHNLERYEEALADYGRAIELDRTDATAFTNRGATYGQLQRYDKALEDHNRAIELRHTFAQAYFNRGVVYSKQGRPREAVADYTQAVKIDPAPTHAFYNRGALLTRLGRDDQAVEDYTKAIVFEPTEPAFFYNRGNALARLARHTEAVDDFTRVISLSLGDVTALINRANSFEKLGLYEQALTDYEQAIKLEPTSARAYYNRGNVFLALGLEPEAFADYSRAIELDRTLVDAYVNLGLMFARRDAWAEALPYLEQAAELGDSDAAHYAARARQELGMTPPKPAATIHNVIDLLVEKFFEADTFDKMHQAAQQFPFMTNPTLLSTVAQIVLQETSPELRPEFEQRLIWLQRIANQKA